MANHWIAHRELTDDAGHLALHVFIGAPLRTDDGRWRCAARFEAPGDEAPSIDYGHGVDAFQALQNALSCIRLRLKGTGLSWLGEKGSPGFPAALPLSFGSAAHDRLEGLVSAEVETLVRQLEGARQAPPM